MFSRRINKTQKDKHNGLTDKYTKKTFIMLGLQYYQSKFYFYFILVWDTKDNLSYSTYVHASDDIVEPQNLFNLNYLQDIVEQYRHSWNPMTCDVLYFFNIKMIFIHNNWFSFSTPTWFTKCRSFSLYVREGQTDNYYYRIITWYSFWYFQFLFSYNYIFKPYSL